MQRLLVLIAMLVIVVLSASEQASAQWGFVQFPRGPFPPYGGYGAGFNPYRGIQGNYGAGFRPSPTPLYNGTQNSGYYDSVTGRSRGHGFTEPGVGYIPPQQYVVPQRQVSPRTIPQAPAPVPDPSMQNILQPEKTTVPRVKIAKWQRRIA